MPRWCRLLILLVGTVVGVVLLAGCQAEVALHVDVNDDGGGTVTARVVLDPEAASRTVLFDSAPLVDDLKATGWTVTGPTQLPDTSFEMVASKSFSQSDQLPGIIEELSGKDGPFRNFQLERSTSFAKRSWTFTGTVDLTKGLAAFSDEELNTLLGGPPLGADKAAQDAALGRPLESIVHMEVQARLPGTLENHNGTVEPTPRGGQPTTTVSTATTAAPGTPPVTGPDGSPVPTTTSLPVPSAQPVVWEPSFAAPAPLELQASSSSSQLAPRLWRWLATAAAVVGLCALLYQLSFAVVERLREYRRGKRRRIRSLPTIAHPEPELEGLAAVLTPDDARLVTSRAGPGGPGTAPRGAGPIGSTGPSASTGTTASTGPMGPGGPVGSVVGPRGGTRGADATAGVPTPPGNGSGRPSGTGGGRGGAVRLLVLETAGVLFGSADPVNDLLMPHVRARGSTLTPPQVNDWYVSRVVGGLAPAEFWAGLGIIGDPMLLDDGYARRYELSPDILDFLRQAIGRGMVVVTVGDEAPEWVGVFRQRFSLDQVIAAWVSSGEVGVRPPHPALVQAALRTTGVAAGATMVIGRNLRLLDGARRLGCRTVQYLPEETALLGDHPLLRTFARAAS